MCSTLNDGNPTFRSYGAEHICSPAIYKHYVPTGLSKTQRPQPARDYEYRVFCCWLVRSSDDARSLTLGPLPRPIASYSLSNPWISKAV